jgi:hypothetical protein
LIVKFGHINEKAKNYSKKSKMFLAKVKMSNAYKKSKNLLNFVLGVFVWFLKIEF